MRIIFVGFATWGYKALSTLIDSDHEVVLVVTQLPTDDPYYSYLNEDVAELAEHSGIPVVRTRHLTAEAAEVVSQTEADLMVVSNWISRIDRATYSSPRLGTLNVHDSLLPKYAGFGSQNWALVNDEAEVGVTVHLMDDGLDTGDIVAQQAIAITPEDTATDLVNRSLDLIPPLLIEALAARESGRATIPQNSDEATLFHRRREPDYVIDWSAPAKDVANLVRAQSEPFPSAFTQLGDERIEVLQASVTPQRFGGTAGRVIYDAGRTIVVCGPRSVRGVEPGLELLVIRTADGVVHTNPHEIIRPGAYLGPARFSLG